MDLMTSKICKKCRIDKPLEDFYIQKMGRLGRQSICKSCERARVSSHPNRKLNNQRSYQRNKAKVAARAKKWRENNLERDREMKRRWWREHPEFNRSRQRERKLKKFETSPLKQRWEYYGSKCWMCGDPATETDHVKPLSKGGSWLPCNARPACKPCNSRKCDAWPMAAVLERISV